MTGRCILRKITLTIPAAKSIMARSITRDGMCIGLLSSFKDIANTCIHYIKNIRLLESRSDNKVATLNKKRIATLLGLPSNLEFCAYFYNAIPNYKILYKKHK